MYFWKYKNQQNLINTVKLLDLSQFSYKLKPVLKKNTQHKKGVVYIKSAQLYIFKTQHTCVISTQIKKEHIIKSKSSTHAPSYALPSPNPGCHQPGFVFPVSGLHTTRINQNNIFFSVCSLTLMLCIQDSYIVACNNRTRIFVDVNIPLCKYTTTDPFCCWWAFRFSNFITSFLPLPTVLYKLSSTYIF